MGPEKPSPNIKESLNHMNKLLSDPTLKSLSSFKFSCAQKYSLFPQATTLPEFFEYNLQSESRVVKMLKGEEAPLRAFYYQLLKLGF